VGHGYGESDFAALLCLAAEASGLELTSEDKDVSDGLGPVFPAALGEPEATE
jgi:hypothetical protein